MESSSFLIGVIITIALLSLSGMLFQAGEYGIQKNIENGEYIQVGESWYTCNKVIK